MADDKRNKPDLVEKLRQAPLSEDDIDQLRASGRSYGADDDRTPADRVAQGGGASAGLRNDERPEENRERQRRAEARSDDERGYELMGKPSREGLEARGDAPDGRRSDPEGEGADRRRQRAAERELGAVSRRAHGGDEQAADHRSLNRREGTRQPYGHAATGDESRVEQMRAEGRFESENARTQMEEDFGEQGRRLPDWADNSKAPSINDPDPDR